MTPIPPSPRGEGAPYYGFPIFILGCLKIRSVKGLHPRTFHKDINKFPPSPDAWRYLNSIRPITEILHKNIFVLIFSQ